MWVFRGVYIKQTNQAFWSSFLSAGGAQVPLGISRVYILYALAKQSQSLGASWATKWAQKPVVGWKNSNDRGEFTPVTTIFLRPFIGAPQLYENNHL